MDIHDMRREYSDEILHQEMMQDDPFVQFHHWFKEAEKIQTIEINAMTLATATADGKPSCRTVLMKGMDEKGLVFFTNYESRKGKELDENPRAMVCLFWHEQMRQICIEGNVEKTSEAESTEYFAKRPRGSQLGAWASKQDLVLKSRDELESRFAEMEKRFEGRAVEKPEYWGGYRLIPDRFEFWEGHRNRLHDRFEYIREGSGWTVRRLAP